MSEQESTRNRLISTGLQALLAKGYDGLGIGPVLTDAGVPKGSFYHYFSSKEDYVIAIIEAYSAHYTAIRAQLFADHTRPPLARLDAYFALLEHEFAATHPAGGCLYGVLSQSLDERGPRLRAALSTAFSSWQEGLAALIAEAQAVQQLPAGLKPQAAAALVIDLYEGVLVRAKAHNSVASLAAFRAQLPQLLSVM